MITMHPCRIAALSIFSGLIVAGCAAHGPAVPIDQVSGVAFPQVVQEQGAGPWLNIPANPDVWYNQSMAAGFDDAVYYCSFTNLLRIGMNGNQTTYPLGCNTPTRDPNGNLYFFTSGGLGSLNPSGTISVVPLSQTGFGVVQMVADKNYNLWAATGLPGVNNDMVQITPSGQVTEFTINFPGNAGGSATGVTIGPDQNVWFSCRDNRDGSCIGTMSLDGSHYKILLVPNVSPPVSGSDGGVWFSEGNAIARIDPATDAITTYPLSEKAPVVSGVQATLYLLYFNTVDGKLFSFNLKTHEVGPRLKVPTNTGMACSHIILGPDENLWMPGTVNGSYGDNCKYGRSIEVYVLRSLSTDPTSIGVGTGQSSPLSATETHYLNGSFTASSTNTTIAQVVVDSKNSWTIEGVAPGSCDITITDILGNSVEVPVIVRVHVNLP